MASSSSEQPPAQGPAHAAVVFVGHHQAGKSTIVGHIITKLGGLDKRLLERVERETSNRPASRYAWVLDRHKLERERAMSVDLKIAQVAAPPGAAAVAAAGGLAAADSHGLALTLLDTPGHPDYLRNTIAAITQSDVAVLVVDSRPAVLEAPSSSAQSRDLALLAASLANHKTLIVAVNQLDLAYESELAEARFNDTAAALPKMVKQRKESLVFVPVSGYNGDNLTKAAPDKMPWYSGPTLLEAVAAAAAAAARPAAGVAAAGAAADLPLRLPILNVHKVGGIGTVPVGRIAGGSLRRGGAATLLPGPRPRGLPPSQQTAPQPSQPSQQQPSQPSQPSQQQQQQQQQQQPFGPAPAPAPAMQAQAQAQAQAQPASASAPAAEAGAAPAAAEGATAAAAAAAAGLGSGAGTGPSTSGGPPAATPAAAPAAPTPAAGQGAGAGAASASAAATGPGAGASAAPVVPIRSIEAFHDSRAGAAAGDFVGVSARGLPVAALRRGHVLCGPCGSGAGGGGGGGGGEPARVAASFIARVQVHRDPTSKRPLPDGPAAAAAAAADTGASSSSASAAAAAGPLGGMVVGRYVPLVAIHTAQAPCRLLRASKLNTKGEVVEADVRCLREGDIAEVELAPLVPLVVEPFRRYPHLGRFAVRGSCRTQLRGAAVVMPVVVAVGRVESVNYVRLEDFRPPAPPADVLARRKARKGRGAAGGGGGGGGGAGAGGGGQAGAGAGPEEEERVTIDMVGEE
ncbi:hypothetical protein HYH02_010920 [Chlamydomonas schloesseri]|uniref:Tr-type G domain-containing protein n=1 Tax=Chlamydomonas schloesseri TaxID=2026947 RepID=A0A835T3L8_9CHLO|nr:hypothetical protein HYH02_010920 [Chlamydomonas schloesseri]|eukprot:KAG2438219.1 hypothetical protein HYH02_010920 [Chlamydomonas schloesseri]